MKLSKGAFISLIVAILIMVTFFSVQTAVVIKFKDFDYNTALFGWVCIITFTPFFFYVVIELIRKIKYKFQSIDDTLSAINSSNALVEFDTAGNIIHANEVFCNLTKYSLEELKKLNHRKLSHLSNEQHNQFWYNLKKGRVAKGEFLRYDKEGKEIWIYGNYNPIKDPYGETYRILKIASDITDKKEIETEVAKKNGYLEHAAKILRHDMHSGINTYIPRGLSSLKRRITTEDIQNLKIKAPLKMIEEGLIHSQKVYRGVKEFTNLVKKDAVLEKQQVDLKEILVNYLNSTSYYKQVIIDDLKECEVNEALFCTAIDNLIRNGLKYNDSSTKYVKIYLDKDTLVVEDNGRGLTNEEFQELSKPYKRKDNQKEGGSGLGLNICIAILNEHNFIVEAEKLKQGTKIKIKVK